MPSISKNCSVTMVDAMVDTMVDAVVGAIARGVPP